MYKHSFKMTGKGLIVTCQVRKCSIASGDLMNDFTDDVQLCIPLLSLMQGRVNDDSSREIQHCLSFYDHLIHIDIEYGGGLTIVVSQSM